MSDEGKTGDHLTASYSRDKGESVVYSAVLAAGALVIFGAPRAPVISLLLALCAVAVAIYHWPYVARERRAISITTAGIMIDRLGLLPWNAISDVSMFERYVRLIRNAEMRIALRRPLDSAIEQQPDTGPIRRHMYRCWKVISPQELSIKLSTLDVPPEDVIAAARMHIQRPV